MRQRGRKSADQLALRVIDAPRPSLEPPPSLTKPERLLFSELAANAPHLTLSDAPLLASYVQATLMSRRSARDPARIDTWEKSTRLQAALATKLRLSPQSRTDPKSVARQMPQRTGPAPWEIGRT
jgi:hypothetical protein